MKTFSIKTIQHLQRVNTKAVYPRHHAAIARLVKAGLVNELLGTYWLTDAGYELLCNNYTTLTQ